ncbi:DUF309 domain-containing protein [Bacteriovorax sp. Seq25_V]|uniref:DUF309 domain-containing protein n=1 Tax=Bacteriovorax sp. Seq25_V TaxID=1201288 RepID=UPI0006986CD4|nr:DUF309 domain-containing protein [Bacteriovorax sp. Seq25_V]
MRYSTIPFPSYRFIPGRFPHPLKEGGHMEFSGEPESKPLTETNYKVHEYYLFSIDLLNEEYFWEAHAYLEAIWNANGRQGDMAKLCQALIKIGAAGVKFKLQSIPASIGHLQRAIEILKQIELESLCGFEIKELILVISHMLSELSKPLPELTIKLGLKI